MLFLLLGLILSGLKYFEMTQVATWPWYAVLAPFGLAALWWSWADWSGYTKRKAVEKEDARKKARIQKSRDNLGLTPASRRKR
jgi:small Trp-rich protein